MRDLEGKIALVTGGGKGVGKVIARTLVERGAHVLINCFHSYDRAKQTQAELVALGGQVDILRASVARKDQVDRMFDEIEERFGHLDILVNNAASGWLGPVDQIGPEHFAKALDANLLGSFWCAMRAAPLMAARGGGQIVNVSSNGAGMVPANYLVVGTSKAAVEALSRHLAAELAPVNIRVNTASCSLITGEVAELFPRSAEMQQVTAQSTPLGRLATAEDLAGVVTFLTSDLSRWVTGQVVLADGGLSLGNAMLSAPREHARLEAAPTEPPPVPEQMTAAVARLVEQPTTAPTEPDDDAIAVVGMGLAVPGANTPEEYWRQVMTGAERFVDVPADRWDAQIFFSDDPAAPDKTYQSRSGFITGFSPDPDLAAEIAEGGVSEDYTARWLRHALHQALRGVGRRADDDVLFAVGYTADGSQHLEESLVLEGASARLDELLGDHPDRERLLAAARRVLDTRLWRGRPGSAPFLPHRLGRAAMRGLLPDDAELLMVDTACSSSLYAMDIGIKSLLLGTADVAVCGGAFALGPRGAVLFSKLHGLSTGGAVRSLDQAADGVLFSDGAGVVVLKRLSRARADGDQVLGLLAGLGASSDGKGKAIYAPSSAGQKLAVERALSAPGVDPATVDWVVAHATGTPAGDLAEFTTLRTSMPTHHVVEVTSNKSLIGHTGWAAGVVSLIEVLLALRHDTIPRQHRFERAPESFAIEEGRLHIPTQPVPWPSRPDRPRSASVSGFGFGGTNAHLVVQEYSGSGLALPEVRPEDRVVLVGWSSHLPDLPEPARVRDWVSGSGTGPAASFGEQYPRPPFDKVRIPPGTLRTLDRCQLMILEAVFGLRSGLGEFWSRHHDRTAVFAGHMGATRNGTLYAARCYLDELERLLAHGEPDAWRSGLSEVYQQYAARVRELVPESNEDSFPGIMPNVVPARVANYLDFHGPNMTIDTGIASTLSALAVALRYLRAGEVDLAIVAGINGNSTPEAQATLAGLAGHAAPLVAEGVVTFALVRESTARDNGLEVLAHVEEVDGARDSVRVGPDNPWAGYLGAAGALEVLRAVLSDDPVATLTSADPDVPVSIQVRTAVRATPTRSVAPDLLDARTVAGGRPTTLRRHVVSLEPAPPSPATTPVALLGTGTVVLTDDPGLVAGLELPPDCLVLSTKHPRRPMPQVRVVDRAEPDAVRQALGHLAGTVRHVLLLTDLASTGDPRENPGSDPAEVLRLHDLLLLVTQAAHPGVSGGGSLVTCLLGALPGGAMHPFAGLFTGFVKSAAIEMPGCFALTLVTSTCDSRVALRQVLAEAVTEQQLPVVVYDGEHRKTLTAREQDAPLPEDALARLHRDSVVLAVGGSRGITSALLEEVARRYQPVLYVVGTTDVSAAGTLPGRSEYVRDQRSNDPSRSVADINAAYDRLANAAAVRANLDRLEQLCGTGRVHYLQADVRDAAQVTSAVQTVLRDAGRVDLLLDTAGLNKSAHIPRKRLEDFRAVRDVKVVGYQNLKRALGDHVPGMWCSFSSFVGFTGQSGEVDYAAGNDFLTTAAGYASQVLGADEFAIGWTLWASVGLGADPVKQTFLEKGGLYTRMSTEEGAHHFLRELHLPAHAPSVVLMGDAEKSALLEYRPNFPVLAAHPPSGRFFLDTVLSRTADSIEVERTFDLDRDAYLAEHSVYGHATLPGTFVTELAAEAAVALEPGRHPVTFEDLSFISFLRVYDASRPVRKKVRATILARTEHETVVDVRILTDVVSPGGVVLQKDKPHFSLVVRMRDEFPTAPKWEHWSAGEDGPATADPYHLPNPSVLLTGAFVSTRDTRQHALGRRAEYDLHVAPDDARFSQFLVPTILLDGLVRVSVLTPVDDGYLTLAAPASMRRIDVYEPANDLQLAARYPTLSLYSTPRGIDLEDPTCGNRCVAVAPDGHVVAQIHDTRTALLGYIHPETGDFRSVNEMAARRRDRYATHTREGR